MSAPAPETPTARNSDAPEGITDESLRALERALDAHPGVARSAVLADEHADGTRTRTAYVMPRRNEAVAADGAELGRQYVAEWQGVYDHVYAQPEPEDPTFDIRGWLSSYTGAELSEDDMRDWVDGTVRRIRGLGARRLLEVGCGTGLLLHRLVEGTDRYLASDISAGAVERIRASFGGRPPAGLELFQAPADDLSAVAPGSVDGFVVNSVSQYFPDEQYLDRVVRGAVDAVAEGGYLFVGDIRSPAVNRAFCAGLELGRAPERAPAEKVQALVERRCCTGTELLIDPSYFTGLVGRLPRVAHVAVLPRRGRRATEMNRYRYDAVIRLDAVPGGEAAVPAWEPWSAAGGVPELRRRLAEERPEALGLLGVPNARILADRWAAELLSRPGRPATAGEVVRAAAGAARGGVEPEDLWELGEGPSAPPYTVRLSWARSLPDGAFDVALMRTPDGGGPAPEVRFPAEPAPPRRPVSRPWYGRVENLHPAKLRAHVRERLADETAGPGRFVLLEDFPLTPGGEPDHAALRSLHWA
ncbi:methyltransferase [Streptomyces sp. NPDC021100]|uniref:methyltransferase n=1 Tax=Streptomyces sp. NPDC021100 TaxID=3365114 RepID=UPI003793EEEE